MIASNVPAGLDPLSDDQIASGVSGGAGLVGGADLPTGTSATRVNDLDDVGIRFTPEELDVSAPARRLIES